MNPTEHKSVREDESSIFYTLRRGRHAVSIVVLKVGEVYVACNLTSHAPFPLESWCSTLQLYGSCISEDVTSARELYARLQQGERTRRVEDAAVFSGLDAFLADSFGTDL